MKFGRWCVSILSAVALLCFLSAASVAAQTLKDDSLKGMKWRLIGPFRGGRVLAVAGVAGINRHVYYFGAVAGGVWKTTDGGTHLVADFRSSSRSPPSAQSPLLRPIPTSSMSAPAKPASAATFPSATASTNLSTPAKLGRTSASTTPAHRQRHRRSARSRYRFRRRAGPRLRPKYDRGVYRSAGRRQDLAERPLQRRQDRRDRPRVRSQQLPDSVRRALAGRAHAWSFESGGPGSGL